MNQRFLATSSVVVLAFLVIVAVVWIKMRPSQQLQNASQAPIVGTAVVKRKAPEFQAATTAGAFDLAKTKKPVFLEIFATWCPHCQRESAVVDRLYAKYKDEMDFVAVNGSSDGSDSTSPETQMDILNFQTKYHVTYPVAFDPQLTIANLYLQGGFPTIAIVNKEKILTYLDSGELAESTLDAAIRKALK